MIIGTLIAISAFFFGYVIVRIVQNQIVYTRFKRNARGLRLFAPTWSPIGHLAELSSDPLIQIKIEAYHRSYGKTFGAIFYDAPMVSTIDLDLIKAMVLDEPNLNINRFKFPMPDGMEKDTLGFAEGDQWRRIRRAISPSFTKHRVQSQNVVDEIELVIEHVLGSLQKRVEACDGGFDLDTDDIMLRAAHDFIFSCFYKQYNRINYDAKEDEHTGVLHRAVNSSMNPLVPYSILLKVLEPIPKYFAAIFMEYGRMKAKIFRFVEDQLALSLRARKEVARAKREGLKIDPEVIKLSDGKVYRRNMIDPFVDNYFEGKISRTEYMNSSMNLYLAGTKTLADALSRTLYYLASHTSVQDKLRESIMEHGIDSEYLTWCINEVLRLEPPVTFGCSRTVEREYEVEGGAVPKGTFVLTHAYTIHRLPEYWGEDANQFKPERWQHADKFHPTQYIAFGLGSRGCPGKEFALIVTRKLMVSLLTRYKFERSSKTSDANLYRSFLYIFLIFEFPTYVKVTKLQM